MTEPNTVEPGSEGIPIDQAVAETSGEHIVGEPTDEQITPENAAVVEYLDGTTDVGVINDVPAAESIPLAEGEQKTPEQTDNGPDADAPELPQDPDWEPDPLCVLPDYSHGPEVTQ